MSRRKTSLLRLWPLLLLAPALAMPVGAMADPCPDRAGTEEECVGDSPWYDWNRLTVHFESSDGKADWLFEISAADEFKITLDEQFGDTPVRGVLIVIEGKVMITSGLELEPGSETESLDTPALVQQLALKLLQHAYPLGREQVLGVGEVRLDRENLYLTASTSRASAEFAPPWEVHGYVDNRNLDWVDFELDFKAPEVDYQAHLSGQWDAQTDPVVFRDSMDISDWRIWPLVPQPNPPPFKPGWPAEDMRIVTLGDLRRILGGG